MVSERFDSTRTLQAQEMTRGWKIRIYKVKELYYPYSENKSVSKKCFQAHDAAQMGWDVLH